MFDKKAVDYFFNGYSCSESVAKAAYECGISKQNLLSVSSVFSGGISSGCLCGAVSAALIILGEKYGRENAYGQTQNIRAIAKEFMEKFKSKYPATCCRVLSAKYEFSSPERKQHCSKMVKDCCNILEDMIKNLEADNQTMQVR